MVHAKMSTTDVALAEANDCMYEFHNGPHIQSMREHWLQEKDETCYNVKNGTLSPPYTERGHAMSCHMLTQRRSFHIVMLYLS